MKRKASDILSKIISALTSMARAKTLAIKSKTRALNACIVIFSLLSDKKFVLSSISHKLHNIALAHHHRENNLKSDGDDHVEDDHTAIVLYNDPMAYQTIPDPANTELLSLPDDINACGGYYGYKDDEDKYPDLRHTMFESEDEDDEGLDEDPGGSVIEMVKNSKEEAGESFSLEEEIDHVADLFIKRFHRQMRIQKQHSFKEFQEMLQRGL